MAPRLRVTAVLLVLHFSSVLPNSVSAKDAISPWNDTAIGFGPDVGLAETWNASFPLFEGIKSLPTNNSGAAGRDGSNTSVDLDRRATKDFWLRVMPLGASITQGIHSSDGNGYRKWIREQLRWQGWQVNMVGSGQAGTMKDRDHEGHPGWVITEGGGHNGVQQAWDAANWMKPNLVLLNVGTNDCSFNIDLPGAGARMQSLVQSVFDAVPGVVVIMSTLIPSPGIKDCAKELSDQFRQLVPKIQNGRLGLADFNAAMDPATMFSDDPIHPNDFGYEFMASVLWKAIWETSSALQAPLDNGQDDSQPISTCAKQAGVSRGPIITQQGSGHDDGTYVHKSIGKGVLVDCRIQKPTAQSESAAIPTHIFFAQLTNINAVDRSAALDDWIRIYHRTATDGKNEYWFRENLGNGNFAPSVMLDVQQNCDGGPTDFWCIGPDTKITVSLNKGTRPPTFENIGVVVPASGDFAPSDVRIADIDGDGRADVCFIHDNGDIGCSRNGGQGRNYYWQGFSTANGLRETVFTGKNKGDKNGIRLADLNGDFRDDWMWVGDQGDVDTWINQRGSGAGIVPYWSASGITHLGMNTLGVREKIKFGRIYGSGRLDYIYLKEEDSYYDMLVWENQGAGGTKRKGSGSDDYVWIYMDGHADSTDFFANIHAPPEWGHSISITLSVPGPRVGIHLADFDGDRRCDVLVQDKATGALTLWHNDYDAATKNLKFSNQGVKSGSASCTQGWGVGIFDRGMRLVDIDGDGRADILCLEPDGRITAWLNTAAGLQNVGQVKFSEGWDRANIRFADVEASGRADLIHLDKYTGAAILFKNDGYRPNDVAANGGSSFHWTNRGVVYSPIDRGENMHFVNFGGLGRADLHHVWPEKNNAETFFNECPGGGSGGDDGPIGELLSL
ncbi:multidomain esterase [Trichoderma asperellum]|uniref:Multidomain esterase n=1 Tax=Trichoderma asperellum TaxID=101201 RepID=A0A6V8QXP4_TRIAP|nr:multidomain esterase [Trichoderma asperellum]